MADYFPLKVGNKWIYDYSFSYFYGATGDDEKITAERIWEIVNISEKNGLPVYKVKDHLFGKKIRGIDWYSRYDTTAIDDTSFFYISEEIGSYFLSAFNPSEGYLFLKRENMPHILNIPICPWFVPDSLIYKISRFHPVYLGDTLAVGLHIDNYPKYFILGQGLFLFEEDSYANHHYHVKMRLKKAELN